jgi:hypothetical protein
MVNVRLTRKFSDALDLSPAETRIFARGMGDRRPIARRPRRINIWNGGTLWDNVLQFIQEQQADIYLFQEVYNGHAETMPAFLKSMEGFTKVLPEYNSVFAPMGILICYPTLRLLKI